jgi:hypothetical protein
MLRQIDPLLVTHFSLSRGVHHMDPSILFRTCPPFISVSFTFFFIVLHPHGHRHNYLYGHRHDHHASLTACCCQPTLLGEVPLAASRLFAQTHQRSHFFLLHLEHDDTVLPPSRRPLPGKMSSEDEEEEESDEAFLLLACMCSSFSFFKVCLTSAAVVTP